MSADLPAATGAKGPAACFPSIGKTYGQPGQADLGRLGRYLDNGL